tara:strand:+ start:22614 stop:22754 length:141 start_codon:yes stop_codon:yes gene_type:complete
MNENQLARIKELVELLTWDYDRLSSSGRKTIDELCKELGIDDEDGE